MRFASLFLAAVLQVLPLLRTAFIMPAASGSTWTWVATWAAGALALCGEPHAVSGASAGISGLVKYSGGSPVGLPTFAVEEPMGAPFRYRITVSNPGSDFAKNYFDCRPLPPGLTINTNAGGSGYISGTPLAAGVYPVTLIAGNLSYPIPATAEAVLTIYLPNAPPVFVTQPRDQSVTAGSDAHFQAEVSGTPPLHFQWEQGGLELPGANLSTLAVTNVSADAAGLYQLVVSNEFGRATSSIVRLTLREPLDIRLRFDSPRVSGGLFMGSLAGPVGTNYVLWRSSDAQRWVPFATNWVIDGRLQFTEPYSSAGAQFYRATLAP